jgi:hypothetical protein
MCQILKTPNKLAIFRQQWCVTASAGKGKIQVSIAFAKQQFKRERNSCRGGSCGDKPTALCTSQT